MKTKFEEPKIEIVEIKDFIVTSPEQGGGANETSGWVDPGHGW